jgi:hypothetical protein
MRHGACEVIFQQYDLDIQTLPKKKFKGNCLQ